jgi:hypothetical protein
MRPCLGHLDLEKGGGFHPDDLQHHAPLTLPQGLNPSPALHQSTARSCSYVPAPVRA